MTHGSLALKLRVLRAERALTIEQAADRAGVQPETISDAERGRRRPYLPTLRKLAAAYEVPVEEILSVDEEPALAGKAVAPKAGPSEGRLDPVDDDRQAVVDKLAKASRDLSDEMQRVREALDDDVKAERLAELLAKLEEVRVELSAELYGRGDPPAGLTEWSGKAVDRDRRQKTRRDAKDASSEAG